MTGVILFDARDKRDQLLDRRRKFIPRGLVTLYAALELDPARR